MVAFFFEQNQEQENEWISLNGESIEEFEEVEMMMKEEERYTHYHSQAYSDDHLNTILFTNQSTND